MTTIPHTIFDHGVGADFDAVHVHPITTPDGVFVTDGCALIHEDWIDDPTYQRIRYTDPQSVDVDWWRRSFRTRTTNIVEGYPQVTIRPWYQMCLEQAGADLTWRSAKLEALTALDDSRRLRAIIGAWRGTYKPTALHDHRTDVTRLMGLYDRNAPTLHPHHAALAALIAVDEREGAPTQQVELELEVSA